MPSTSSCPRRVRTRPGKCAVAEARRRHEAQDADAVVVVAPPGVERGEHDAGALGAQSVSSRRSSSRSCDQSPGCSERIASHCSARGVTSRIVDDPSRGGEAFAPATFGCASDLRGNPAWSAISSSSAQGRAAIQRRSAPRSWGLPSSSSSRRPGGRRTVGGWRYVPERRLHPDQGDGAVGARLQRRAGALRAAGRAARQHRSRLRAGAEQSPRHRGRRRQGPRRAAQGQRHRGRQGPRPLHRPEHACRRGRRGHPVQGRRHRDRLAPGARRRSPASTIRAASTRPARSSWTPCRSAWSCSAAA